MSEGPISADSSGTLRLHPLETAAWVNSGDGIIFQNDTIELWRAKIDSNLTPSHDTLLDPDDLERAGGMAHDGRKTEFVSGLLLLQAVREHHPRQPLQTSLSHSHRWVVAAAAPKGPVGIDVEWIDTRRPHSRLVRRFFGPAEQNLYGRLCPGERPLFFCRLWTAKEALFKAAGLQPGTRHFAELPIFTDSGIAEIPATVRVNDLILHWFFFAPGFIGACAVSPEISRLKFYSVKISQEPSSAS